MARERPASDALLCGRCGYTLDGVLGALTCPECGTPTVESLPSYRIGSPWQRRPSPASWVTTGGRLLFRWDRLFARVWIDGPGDRWLRRLNLSIGALLLGAAVLTPSLRTVFQGERARPGLLVGALFVVVPAAYVALLSLTLIEEAGLRLFGNRRGGRVTPGIAAAVCAHASYGWILAGLLSIAGAWLAPLVPVDRWLDRWLLGLLPRHVMLGSIGFFGGLLVFETLSFLGVRRCRFANPRGLSGASGSSSAGAIGATLAGDVPPSGDQADQHRR